MALACSAGLCVGVACLGDEISNRLLLETLPYDRRASLVEALEEFGKLDAAEQTRIRRLDAAIAAVEPLKQARYRAAVQNYHLWFQGLTEEQRTALLGTADLDERFQLARKYRLAENAGPKRNGPRIARIRTGDLGLTGPYEMAFYLKVWAALPPEKQAEIATKPVEKVSAELKAQAKNLKIRLDPFPPEQEKAYAEKFEQDADFKPLLDQMMPGVGDAIRKGDAAKKAENRQKRFEHPFAEFLYFEENHPRPITDANLARFAESCPEWLHVATDSLAADDARDYFAILYRLIYPTKEMPEPTKGAKGPAPAAKKAPTPGTKPDGAGAAF